MKHTPNSAPKTTNYRGRRLGAAALLLTVGLVGAQGARVFADDLRHVQYVNHPNTIPEKEAVSLQIGGGDTAFDLGHRLAAEDTSRANDLTAEIQNQADKKGLLHPGQTVEIERSLVDADKLPELLKLQEQTVPPSLIDTN